MNREALQTCQGLSPLRGVSRGRREGGGWRRPPVAPCNRARCRHGSNQLVQALRSHPPRGTGEPLGMWKIERPPAEAAGLSATGPGTTRGCRLGRENHPAPPPPRWAGANSLPEAPGSGSQRERRSLCPESLHPTLVHSGDKALQLQELVRRWRAFMQVSRETTQTLLPEEPLPPSIVHHP